MPKPWTFLDDVSNVLEMGSRRTAGPRNAIAVLNAVLLGLNLGLPVAVLWIAAYFISELITRATVAAVERAPEPGQRLKLNLLLGMVVATLVWLAAILLYWRSGGMAERLTAIVILATLMIHAQSFAFRSKAALLVVGGLPALTLILLPAFFGDFYGIERVTLVMLAIGAVAQMGLSTMVNARTFAALQDARGEAINANHAKSAFLAMMSHELRTPMNGVLGMAHALKLDRLRPRQAEQVDMLIRSGDGLMTILNDILDLSKIEAGKLELEAIAFDLHDLGARVAALWTEAADAKGLALVYDLDPAAPQWVRGDPNRLRQVMLNLISNALKFTETGRVELSIRSLPGARSGTARLEIAVSDTGPGMTEDQADRLFQAFTQAGVSVARKFGGTGLGLAISKHLSDLMDGDIRVETRVGVGSTFRLTLALPLAEGIADVAAPAAIDDPGLGDLRVLVVDDNTVNQAVARAILEAAGADVETAADGAEALAMMSNQAFSVVLMDVHMPRMGGVEAVRRIRAGEAGDIDTPVIALTADAMAGEDSRLAGLGFDGLQAKPIQPGALIAAVETAARAPAPRARKAVKAAT